MDLWYQIAILGQFDLRPGGWPFVVIALVLVTGGGWCSVRGDRPTSAGAGSGEPAAGTVPITPVGVAERRATGAPRLRAVRPVVLLAGVVVLLVAVTRRGSLGVFPVTLLAMALVVFVVAPVVRGVWSRTSLKGSGARPGPIAEPRQVEHVVAALVSLAIGALSFFILKPNSDDVFYLNRAAWVAEHGTATLRDTMFGAGTYPQSFGFGLPTPSIEAFQGVLASMLHVEAGTAAYLVYTPVQADGDFQAAAEAGSAER